MNYWVVSRIAIRPLAEYITSKLSSPFVLVDGGAAGGVSEPFDTINDLIVVVRFEPRGEEVVELNEKEIFINGGVFSSDCKASLHIAKMPTTSSIFPPNTSWLEQFNTVDTEKRVTVKKTEVELRSIDSCVTNGEMPLPDFIKLDVHSSEYPAIEGALSSLRNCIGFLVETWNSPVHLGQKLNCHVEELLYNNGYLLHDLKNAAYWHHEYDNMISELDRKYFIGSESLFIRNNTENIEDILKSILVYCLFNYSSKALQISELIQDEIIRKEIRDLIFMYRKKRRSSRRGFTMLIKKLMR